CLLPRSCHPHAPHSFPTRRSSDLLDRARLRPPYVLVGHSFGVQVVRVFAGTYPTEVAGLVFVDGAQEELEERMAPFLTDEGRRLDRKSTRLNSSHSQISYAVSCLK